MYLQLSDKIVITSQFSNGEEAFWNAQVYSKIKDLNIRANRLFDEVNSFFKFLPQYKLEVVENYYRAVLKSLAKSSILFSGTEEEYKKAVDEITNDIIKETSILFSVVTLEDIAIWASINPITIPDSISAEHHGSYSVDGTYLIEDYKRLWELCIVFRMIMPVWCEYLTLINGVITPSKHEVKCLWLLSDCPNIIESPAMEKLKSYVNEKGNLDITKASTAILNGVSRAEIPEWITAVTIVKRLGIGELSQNEERSHLVTSIFGYIQGILTRDLDRKNTGRIRDKFAYSSRDDDDDKPSFIEQYKVRQDITEGDVVLYETFVVKFQEKAAKSLVKYRNFSKEQMARYLYCVNTCIAHTNKLHNTKLLPVQETILKWTVNDLVPHQMVNRLSNEALRVLLGIAQGYIWYFKLPDIAVALTAYSETSLEQGLLIAAPNARISPGMHLRISSIYKHSHPRSYNQQSEEELRATNVGVNPIREVIRGLNNNIFIARAPEELFAEAESYQKSGRVIFKAVSEQMVALIETINEVI